MLGKVLLRNSPRDAVPTNRKMTLREKIRSRRKVIRTPTWGQTHRGRRKVKAELQIGSRVLTFFFFW